MASLVFDIETIGEDFNKMDKATRQALTYWIERESMSETEYKKNVDKVKERLGLSPLTGKIISIAVYNPDTEKGAVFYDTNNKKVNKFSIKEVDFISCNEKEILENFWEAAEKYNEFVTYNGQSFDIPYILVRSAVHRVKPTKNIMSNRYYRSQDPQAKHVDLMDQLTFYGAVMSRPKLHLVCRALGVKTPKVGGVDGGEVGKMYKKGFYKEIAEYNLRDVIATGDVYKIWREYFKFDY